MNTSLRFKLAAAAFALCLLQAQAALNCSITNQGNQVVISWASESGKTYALRRSDQPDGSWRVVSLKTAAAEPLSVTAPVEGRTAFFRLIEAPPNPDPEHLVWIPPGTFTMGSPTNEMDRSGNEGPQTTVTISAGFWMGKCEVTQGEYEAVMGNNPSWFNGVRQDWPAPGMTLDFGSDPDRPVEDLQTYPTDYCAKLTNRERANGRIGADLAYRLPTEAEWEYACRAGTTTRFSYGDDPGYSDLANYAWYGERERDGGTTHPVGQKLPNPWGLYDLHGNVWEWCQDCWSFSLPGGSVVDPQGPAGPCSNHVERGGCFWNDGGNTLRSALRNADAGGGGLDLGFRVVLAPGPP